MHEARAHQLLAASAAIALLAVGAADAKVVEKGDRGAAVKRLQRALGITPDGIFGPGTRRAVKRFQARRGLSADGVAGPATWNALGGRARTATATRGASVRVAQRRLGVGADGVFGPNTKAAVKRFQRRHGLAADGIVGPATWKAMGLGATRPVLTAKRSARGGGGNVIARAVAAANRIARLPYKYGGGHGSFSDSGYDCSGSVSYVLHGAGLLSSPKDSSALMSYGSPGRGRRITVYANPGHAFMVIDGRRYDTTGRAQTGSRWQPSMRSTAGYVARHPAGL